MQRASVIEALEARIAPAVIFAVREDQIGSQLLHLLVTGAGMQGKDLSITAKARARGGDGFVNVGRIFDVGVALGKVTVGGDLGRFSGGNVTDTAVALTVHSMGQFGLTTQDPRGASLDSQIGGRLGALTVQTDMVGATIASSIAAGVKNPAGTAHFGDGNDVKIPGEPLPLDAIFAKIASLTIKGFAAGSAGIAGDHYGIVAEQIGSVKIGAKTFPLTTGPRSPGDLPGRAAGATRDFTIHEV